MSIFKELLNPFKPHYVPFPAEPKIIRVDGFTVHEYVTPKEMDKIIKNLSNQFDFRKYDTVLVNKNGGNFLFDRLADLKKFKGVAHEIEYHRPEKGFGAIIEMPVPDEAHKSKAVVIDDIYDSGGVFEAILKNLSPESLCISLVRKRGINGQIAIPNILVGLEIDNVWVGGVGMNLGIPEEGYTFRNHPGLVVKIQQ